ncbi:DNA repair protein RadC [Thiospirochaeta perfilievii]|uniref:DNA repair protein RadC n=1 Tax=Thiospirochaeta perfilievii TaxID=252967 RepID=A0A5C1Q7Q7_9SPIO|nr:JAB domain-containing protein [Thiospirochaeta perfilievii]QEN03338.1 DNA repair protein RadC [Thiospirochaeta perfilievii]
MKYQIISERTEKYEVKVSYPTDLLPCLKRYRDLEKEHFIVATLNGAHEVISVRLITIGILNRTLIHPREVFRPAIADNSASIILVHNHPSGNIEPSEEDKLVTKRLVNAGDILGIKVLDHMIIGTKDYYSFAEGDSRYLEPNRDNY